MPVILMHAQVHETMGLCTMEEMAPIMLFFARRATVPVCVHLDHGEDLDYVRRGVELGFTSVMYDGLHAAGGGKHPQYGGGGALCPRCRRIGGGRDRLHGQPRGRR